MGYTTDSLVIETRTIRCGKCFKVDEDGVFRGNEFHPDEIIAECDRYTGNCQIVPIRGVSDPIIDMVKCCWEITTIIMQLVCRTMKNVLEVKGYQWNPQAKTYNRKWIAVKTKSSAYWLCFDRMYLKDAEHGVVAETIYGSIQFYRDIDTSHKAEGPNMKIIDASKYRYSTWDIFYSTVSDTTPFPAAEWAEQNGEERVISCYRIYKRV